MLPLYENLNVRPQELHFNAVRVTPAFLLPLPLRCSPRANFYLLDCFIPISTANGMGKPVAPIVSALHAKPTSGQEEVRMDMAMCESTVQSRANSIEV